MSQDPKEGSDRALTSLRKEHPRERSRYTGLKARCVWCVQEIAKKQTELEGKEQEVTTER